MVEETPMEQQAKEDISDIAYFDPTKKKKKKKKLTKEARILSESGFTDDTVDPGDDIFDEYGEQGGAVVSTNPREATDGDYRYEELLKRMFSSLRESHPELAGDRSRAVMRPPDILLGATTTAVVNFKDLCSIMHRQPEDVKKFLMTEMGTIGTFDGQDRLVVKGRFAPKILDVILRRYINEYVICNICKSPSTLLVKENHHNLLRCEQAWIEEMTFYMKSEGLGEIGLEGFHGVSTPNKVLVNPQTYYQLVGPEFMGSDQVLWC